MAVWVVRGGNRQRGYEETFMSDGRIAVDRDFDRAVSENVAGSGSPESLPGYAENSKAVTALWKFAHEIHNGDMVVLPRKSPKVVAVGRVSGKYEFRTSPEPRHTRRVKWIHREIPWSDWDAEFPYFFAPGFTVFESHAEDAESRIEKLIARLSPDSPVDAAPDLASQTASSTSPGDDLPRQVDLEGLIADQIVDRIRRRFSGGRLAYLVASILRASGYYAAETGQESDGGVDVVAGRGDMGFGHPRLCVQVKAGPSPADIGDYEQLQGGIRNYGADHGLLVSLEGFTAEVRNENVRSFFQIRLWGPDELVNRLLETYDHLPEDIRSEILLKSRGILIDAEC